MNIFNFFRKSSFIFISAIGFLTLSCTQYDLNSKRSFSYALYNTYKEQNLKLFKIDINGQSRISLEDSKGLLQSLNNYYGSDLSIPDEILEAMVNTTNIDDIKTFALNEDLLNNEDIISIDNFIQDIKTDDFEIAINKFEEDIISNNLSEDDFIKYDNIASTVKILNDENPELFYNPEEVARGILSCLVSYLLWIVAIIAFVGGCATVFLCVLAGISLVAATIDVATECAGIM